MSERQRGLCSVCGKDVALRPGRLVVAHDYPAKLSKLGFRGRCHGSGKRAKRL